MAWKSESALLHRVRERYRMTNRTRGCMCVEPWSVAGLTYWMYEKVGRRWRRPCITWSPGTVPLKLCQNAVLLWRVGTEQGPELDPICSQFGAATRPSVIGCIFNFHKVFIDPALREDCYTCPLRTPRTSLLLWSTILTIQGIYEIARKNYK